MSKDRHPYERPGTYEEEAQAGDRIRSCIDREAGTERARAGTPDGGDPGVRPA